MFRNISTWLLQSVQGKPINEAENTAISTMVAIMGRISAYTGKETTYEEMMNSDLKLGPKVFEFGPVDIDKSVPIAGLALCCTSS